jgi:hypothetical protein
MKWRYRSIEARLVLISRIVIIFSMILFASAVVVIMAQGARWLIVGLLVTGGLLIFVNWVVPGVLIILGYPSLAYAWLHGVNPLVFSSPSWESLSSEQRKSVYLNSMVTLFAIIAFIVWAISEQ